MPRRMGLLSRAYAAYSKRERVNTLKTGKVLKGVFAVETGTVNFYIYRKGQYALCIDTGCRKAVIKAGLESLGINAKDITHVFLTHSDFDHVGGLGLFENAKIYLSRAEERMLQNKQRRLLAFHNPMIKREHTLLDDDETVQIGPVSVRAILTPGHTPGSMCFLINGSLLFTGDTVRVRDGVILPSGHYNMDEKTQEASVRKLARLYGIAHLFTAHSGRADDFPAAFAPWR